MENTQVGPFRIIRRLGRSRRDRVFHAIHESQQREVALKFIGLPKQIQWDAGLDKIERETAELRKLRHENLVRIYGVGVHQEASQLFFATEFIDGEALSAILARRGKLAPDLVVEYGHQIATALQYLHEQELVHTKLTPDKILVTADHHVKVSDVRLNRPMKRRWDATPKRDLELAAYMAPEQFSEGANQKSDFYALGVILFELLTGKLPYEPENLGRIAKAKKEIDAPSVAEQVMNCPIWLDKIVTQMVQADPKQRPHSARAITFAFEEIKKIDASRQSAASQVAGHFSPLNAGVDKTKARQALGTESGTEKVNHTPFWKRTSAMMAALVAITAMTVWAAMPKTPQAILDDAQTGVASRDPEQWRLAAVAVKPLMGSADDAIAARAGDLYFKSKGKVLEMNGRRGVRTGARSFYTDNVKAYIDATQEFLAGDHATAKAEFERLVLEISAEGDERYVHRAAAKQLQQLVGVLSLPQEPETLSAMVQQYDNETEHLKLIQGQKVLQQIVRQFGRSTSHVKVCKAASEQLESIRIRLDAKQASSEENRD